MMASGPITSRQIDMETVETVTDFIFVVSNALATWWEKLTHWQRPWCWERLKAGTGEDRGWDGWMASLTQRTWVWASSRSWWWTGKPGVLQSMGSQRVGHNWVAELNWINSLPAGFSQPTDNWEEGRRKSEAVVLFTLLSVVPLGEVMSPANLFVYAESSNFHWVSPTHRFSSLGLVMTPFCCSSVGCLSVPKLASQFFSSVEIISLF